MPLSAIEKKYPWFYEMTRYRFGLRGDDRPDSAELGFPVPSRLPVKQYGDLYAEWDKFKLWEPWYYDQGHKPPRPKGLWGRQPNGTNVPDWAWRIGKEKARHDHAANPHPFPPAPHNPAFTLIPSKTKNKPGMYYYTYVNSIADPVAHCAQNKLWAALLVHELARAPEPSYDTQEQRKALQAAGVTVIASGWVESGYNLEAQAEAAARFSAGFDEYMLNAEASWAYVPGQPTTGFDAMGKFAPLLRSALGPKMPISLSCMWGQVTWLRPLLEAGLSCVRPQCYMNQWQHMVPGPWVGDPLGAVGRLGLPQNDLPAGLPAHMVDPTYGTYGSFFLDARNNVPFHRAAQQAGAGSGSIWAAEFVPAAQYPVVATY
jgi:hypothetical protein